MIRGHNVSAAIATASPRAIEVRRLPASTTGLARLSVLSVVVVSGFVSLGVEFGASRLLAPYFGTSLYVWGVLIGLVLIYLSAGYVLGGWLADRKPRADVLYRITAWAGLWIALIPLVSYPVLVASQQGFKTLSIGLVAGTLLAVVLLFAAPVVLLGCVSPFAIRLLLKDVESGGNTSGRVYALSTAGSILGTFLPVFWLIPTFGTRPTLEAFGLVLVTLSAIALWPQRKFYATFAAVVILAWILVPAGIKAPQDGQLLYEKDSAYNYIQVVQVGTRTELILNEGMAVQSVYDPTASLTGGPWDYLLLASAFRPRQPVEQRSNSVAILGLAGGTAAREYAAAFGPGVSIIGVEIDPDIVAAAYAYLHLGDLNLHPVVADARYWLETQAGTYDAVFIDAYRQPYIPFHLTTREFFASVRSHLGRGGTAVADVGHTESDYRLVDAVASTMAAVFPSVFLVDSPRYTNTLVFGTTEPATLDDVRHNLGLFSEPLAEEVASTAVGAGNLRTSPYHGQVFTDDLAPVERLIDEIIFSYVTQS
ncbi:MAG TPA: fused MFS/spermidine synthase [Candidatus Dormibacteraeota bacterium]|nr:fused MFS/spermidine synthase [Candidatus Dormibacteraeota bacterium]